MPVSLTATVTMVCKRLSAGPPARHVRASGSLRLGGLKFNNKVQDVQDRAKPILVAT
ncbi:hypothetical protein BDY19DRAFT_981266 [Irpex rosettiformis]|uniref:Uncharacterized protein n=1 Tax=Irpex rosettiformis TaxID=378272 RepID=A0ACB8TM33_9APHY|nr:hypothetical protein BDY19DRAFT_981266 [Irpex rosettiformis]